MQPSMELRWFLTGAVPAAIQHWFSQGAPAPKKEVSRADTYLSLPHCEDVGIKQRQGRMEVKRRLAEWDAQPLADGIAGRIEQWVKWSFVLDQAQSFDLSEPTGSWVTIKKARQLKKYEVTSNAEVNAVDAASQAEQGCNLELTELVLHGAAWWSLGFEAFGQMDAVENNLAVTIKHVLAEKNFPSLPAEASYSYPKWLSLQQA